MFDIENFTLEQARELRASLNPAGNAPYTEILASFAVTLLRIGLDSYIAGLEKQAKKK